MSLRTEQRDADGNILYDSEGKPIMVHIAKGMNVFPGQVLGNFDDHELYATLKINQAQLEVAKAERDKQIEVEYAAQGVQVAWIEHRSMVEANKQVERTFPAMEVLRAEYSLKQAEANLELQKYNIDEVKTREFVVRENELERTQVQIDRRKIIAPIDGMIVDISAAEGKWLREGDPVLEIMKLDTLWVQVLVPATKYTASDLLGKRATIRATLANGKVEAFQGTVIFCHPNIDPDYTFKAFIEIQNKRVGNFWLLQPGRGEVDIVIPL
jgi:multidrug resistance efflux pump